MHINEKERVNFGQKKIISTNSQHLICFVVKKFLLNDRIREAKKKKKILTEFK